MTSTHRFVADHPTYPTASDWLETEDQDEAEFLPVPWVLDPEWDHQAERSTYGMGGHYV